MRTQGCILHSQTAQSTWTPLSWGCRWWRRASPTLMEAREGADLVVAPRDLDGVIAHGSALLAGAINRALQPRLSLAQLCWLAG